jgi:hypothetical protein
MSVPPTPRPGAGRRTGQIAIFLMMALVVLSFMVLWSVDVRRIVFMKGKSQDAGDASALAAARWQGSTLNLIGEANLLRALAVSAGNDAADDALAALQARLCFTGPMAAFAASQQAAKLNGIYARPDYTEIVLQHANTVRNTYTTPIDGDMLFPEPYLGAWTDYALMLEAIASDGIAAGPDNAQLYSDSLGGHILYDRAFYDAVISQNWCWFHHNYPDLLTNYTDHTFWAPLPEVSTRNSENAEFFALHLIRASFAMDRVPDTPAPDTAALQNLASQAGLDPTLIATQATQTVRSWYAYNPGRWGNWAIMHTDGPESFPITGSVLPQYDYSGADAVIRVETAASRLTPGLDGSSRSDNILWTAAAKPFGYLESDGARIRPDAWSLVLPAYHDIRLIPIDAASTGNGGFFDIAWRRHITEHLPIYVANGTTEPGCTYCVTLTIWENPAFRSAGALWLSLYSSRCVVPPGPGGEPGGGTRRGH